MLQWSLSYMCRFELWFSQDICPRVGLLGHMVVLELPTCSPWWVYQFTFPPTVQEGSLFSTPSPAFIVCRFLESGHFNWCGVICHCSFDLHFSDNEWCWCIFICLLAICMSSLGKRLYIFCLFFDWVCIFLILSCLYILESLFQTQVVGVNS